MSFRSFPMPAHAFSFVAASGNAKTGPIPVTMTAAQSCPKTCPLSGDNAGGCHAESGMVAIHWRKLTAGTHARAIDANGLFAAIRGIIKGSLWRHNVSGDLLADDTGRIDAGFLAGLVKANKGKRGFTYTHHLPSIPWNASLIRNANAQGFTVNLSANSLDEADVYVDMNIGPVVVLLDDSEDNPQKIRYTNKGKPVVVCPAVTVDSMTCQKCGLCANSNRRSIVGFPVHGISKGKARKVIMMKAAG